MKILDKIKGVFSPDELKQVQAIPSSINMTNSHKGHDEDDDMTPQEWNDHQFDVYAQQYHSLDPSEHAEFMRSQDTFWMMQ